MQFPDSFFEDEVKNGFYIPSLIKRGWAAQLEILEIINNICQKHQIKWFAMFGTLLGAVRHGSYIPWDDDLDICMLRDDYNHFFSIAEKELPDGYYISTKHSNSPGCRPFTSVWNRTFFSVGKQEMERYHGCPFPQGLDIFPLDYIAPDPDDEELRKHLAYITYHTVLKLNDENQNTDEMKNVLAQIQEMLNVKLDYNAPLKEQLFTLLEGLSCLYGAQESTEVVFMLDWICGKIQKAYPVEWFKNPVMIPFEGMLLPAPSGYDTLLKIRYGDYRTPCRNTAGHNYPFFRAILEQIPDCQNKHKIVCTCPISIHDLKKNDEKHLKTAGPTELTDKFSQLAQKIHIQLLNALKDNAAPVAQELLTLCQKCAIDYGNTLEQMPQHNDTAIKYIEEYCESLWQIHEALNHLAALDNPDDVCTHLDDQMKHIKESIKKEIVFLPWKASCWPKMEPYWRDAQTAGCNTYVIPLPWYYRKSDRTFGEMNYEGTMFPEYVPVTDYRTYDLKRHMSDMIFIQNPYDEYNCATSIHPSFYAKTLRQYTRKLIYIPWFTIDEIEPDDNAAIYNMRYYVSSPGVAYADQVIAQSEQMRLTWINFLVNISGEDTRNIWEEKITGPDVSPLQK